MTILFRFSSNFNENKAETTENVKAYRKNDAETDQKEKKELVGSLTEKKLSTEGCTGRNREREKSSRQKKMIDDIKICGSYAETKRKAENRENWRMLGLQEQIEGQTGRSFQTHYKEHITAKTKLHNTSTYAEHITNANHTYRDIITDTEILHIQPKSQKLNTLEQYEIYRHMKTHLNDILNTQLNFKTHTLFDSTLRTHPHRKQEAPRPTTTSSEDDPK
ncbi:hypothetical protein ANN_23149 [Periplaneta americana]|uniref:Uncharacterized protein n=1 Tax=Periplaneta americana TaxID=6978 RepID=A0ABQ8SLR0_PERAM|nr:hypothetical protein ANN_23149 [Periplaneta americana]